MTAAFKEWAIVVDALAHGQQIFILRKGGIHEGRGGFQPEYPRFLFFPTLFHQQRESVVPNAQTRYDAIAPYLPAPDVLRLQYWAELADSFLIEDFEAVRRLKGQHIWRDEVLQERFEWGRERAIFALALRVYELPTAVELPMLAEYGGCKSWVQVAHPISTAGSRAVLDEAEFANRLTTLRTTVKAQS